MPTEDPYGAEFRMSNLQTVSILYNITVKVTDRQDHRYLTKLLSLNVHNHTSINFLAGYSDINRG